MSVIKRVLLLKTLFFSTRSCSKPIFFRFTSFNLLNAISCHLAYLLIRTQRLIIIFAYHCQFLDAIHKHTAQKAHNGRSKGVGGDTVGANRVNRSFYCYCFTSCILVQLPVARFSIAFITCELQLKIESTVIYLVVRYTVHFSQ